MAKRIATFESGRHSATVHARNSFGEFGVRFYVEGVHAEDSDYFTEDKQDALATARHCVESNARTDSAYRAA